MPACESCHCAKTRCQMQYDTNGNPTECIRCQRNSIKCIPRMSRQGQGPKKRKRKTAGLVMDSADAVVAEGVVEKLKKKEALDPKLHFGILYLVHSWTSFAFSRRSFSLLSRASGLAAKVGIPMDQIFNKKRQRILEPLFWSQPQSKASSSDSSLTWADLPSALLRTCGVDPANSESFGGRYIWIREAKDGDSRFLTSQAFRNEIASDWLLEQTWKANERSIIQVLTEGPADNNKFTSAVEYQMARYADPDTPPERIRVNGFHVSTRNTRTRGSNVFREMDLFYAFEIVTLEHSFYLAEFVPSDIRIVSSGAPNHEESSRSSNMNGEETPSLEDPFPLLGEDLDDIEMDDDMKQILALIND